MADAKKQCRWCRYWMRVNGNVSPFCHHLLLTDKRRVEVDGICKSFEKAKKKGVTYEQAIWIPEETGREV